MIIILTVFLLNAVVDGVNDTTASQSSVLPSSAATQNPIGDLSEGVELYSDNVTSKLPFKSVSDFQPDCSDPHNKEITCSVHIVNCSEKLFDDVPSGEEPPEAHDLRVEAFAKAMARQERHQLHVDISWQMPPKNSSVLLRAFKLEINGTDGNKCFVFNVTDFGWTQDSASPRFHFTSESLFEFSEGYRITLFSLPKSLHRTPTIVKESRMPVDPELNYDDDQRNISQYCKTHTNTEASKWTAAFRRIFLKSITRTIQIEFVGAPPHFCFEEYEVRLLDETGIELLHHTVVKAKDMKKEIIDGKVVYFGEHNFTGLEYGVDYIPSVIPVEMSSDGRCLCPTSEQHGACSCIAADWKRVRLQRIEKPAPVVNITMPPIARVTEESNYWPFYVVVIAFCLLFAFCAIITLLLIFYRKYAKRGKSVRIRFISDHISNNGMVTAEPRAPLIYNYTTSVLLVYSHDCPQHEATVLALAELLRDTFKLDVHLDAWDEEDIAKNLNEYINASVVKADKIVVINSVGAYHRVRARYLGEEVIERVNKSPLDGLFLSQVDLALQHARVISARFSYTPSNATLFALTPLLQYTIPQNLSLFVASLSDSQLRNDPRLAGFNPQLARLQTNIAAMSQLVESDQKWFEKSHHRVPRAVISMSPLSLDSGIATTSTTVPPGVRPLPLNSHIANPIASLPSPAGVVVAGSRLEEDARPLLEEDADEAEIAEDQQSHGDSSNDSAFHSAVVTDEIPPEREVLDKPRLVELPDKQADTYNEIAAVEFGLKHRDNNENDDSGMISGPASGQLL
ncbi:hypothetical protein Q1695_007475 [Nippostrongylus brasiliensis]|nr:hypothetical protein Q1695_007475 [Nippostrongylus brasiliensis]